MLLFQKRYFLVKKWYLSLYITFWNKISICIPITFNNPYKAFFSNKKYILQSKRTKHVKLYFLMKKQVFSRFLKVIGVQI